MIRRSLVSKLLLLTVAAVILPSLFIAIALRSISSNALKDSILQQQTQLAQRIAEEVNGEIGHAQSLMAVIAHGSFFSAGSRIDQYEAMRNLMRESPAFQEIMFVNDDGQELLKINQQILNPRLGRRSEDVHQPYVGLPFFAFNRSPTIILGEPIHSFSNPTRTGALLAKMSFASLGDMMRQTHVGPHGIAFIVDQRGNLLAHPEEQRVLKHENLANLPAVNEWIQHQDRPTDLFDYVDAKGGSWISLAYPIPLLKSAVVIAQPRADIYAPVHRMRTMFIAWSAFCVIFFMTVALAIGWRILQPLRQMQRAAEEVGRGHLNVKLNVHTHDELEDLASTFQRMAASLAELEKVRGDLISMIVHDLKMPLSSILPCLDSLIQGDVGSVTSEQVRFLRMARRSSQEMLMLIQNLLDVARMEDGKMTLNLEEFLPADWAESVIFTFRPIAEAGQKRLQLSVAPGLPTGYGDVALLSRVLGNLISNALRHTVIGSGEVIVALFRDGSQLAVEIRDNGEGIPEEEQQRIFEKFVQGDGPRGRVRLGTGLGLTFCKMVIEAHGGRISVFSTPNEGSMFTFRLPLKETSESPTPLVPITKAVLV